MRGTEFTTADPPDKGVEKSIENLLHRTGGAAPP